MVQHNAQQGSLRSEALILGTNWGTAPPTPIGKAASPIDIGSNSGPPAAGPHVELRVHTQTTPCERLLTVLAEHGIDVVVTELCGCRVVPILPRTCWVPGNPRNIIFLR